MGKKLPTIKVYKKKTRMNINTILVLDQLTGLKSIQKKTFSKIHIQKHFTYMLNLSLLTVKEKQQDKVTSLFWKAVLSVPSF